MFPACIKMARQRHFEDISTVVTIFRVRRPFYDRLRFDNLSHISTMIFADLICILSILKKWDDLSRYYTSLGMKIIALFDKFFVGCGVLTITAQFDCNYININYLIIKS